MTESQAISGRACLQAATLLCAYAAARYQKLSLPKSSALTFMAAGVLQGVSTKVRMPLGERSRWNWLLDAASLGLVVYGTSKLELAKRVKYLTAGVMSGTQVLISNARPHTFFGRVAAIDVKKAGAEEEVHALYDQLVALKDQLKPQDFIRACIALFPKARPFSRRNFINSAAKNLQDMHREALERLAGWEKTAAQMHFYELSNTYCIYFTEGTGISKEGLNAEEMAKRQEWLDTTGLWIKQRWAIWELEKKRGLEGRWNALKELMKAPACRLTVDQKIDLSNEYIKRAYRLEGGIAEDSSCLKACIFKGQLIARLEGFKKCQAYMKHAEFYSRIGIKWPKLFRKIFPGVEATLSESEKRHLHDWLDTTGLWIKQRWEVWELENKEDLKRGWKALKALIKPPTCRLTFDQKVDLLNEYIRKAFRLETNIPENHWFNKACDLKENLIDGLERFEKCQAYMKHAEFYFYIGIKGSYLFDDIFLKIPPTLSESEQSQFQDWMDKTGSAIQASWEEK